MNAKTCELADSLIAMITDQDISSETIIKKWEEFISNEKEWMSTAVIPTKLIDRVGHNGKCYFCKKCGKDGFDKLASVTGHLASCKKPIPHWISEIEGIEYWKDNNAIKKLRRTYIQNARREHEVKRHIDRAMQHIREIDVTVLTTLITELEGLSEFIHTSLHNLEKARILVAMLGYRWANMGKLILEASNEIQS